MAKSPAAAEKGAGAQRVRRRERKNITSGVVHVNASFNNTMVTISDEQGTAAAVCEEVASLFGAATALLTRKPAGLQTIGVMEGGVNRWLAEGRPAINGAPRMSLERQVRIVAGAMAALGGFLALFVDVRFAALSAFVGSGLVFAGVTDTCMMGMLIAKAPWNRTASCDASAVVKTLLQEN